MNFLPYFFTTRFYITIISIAFLFIAGFFIPSIEKISWFLLAIVIGAVAVEFFILIFSKKPIQAERICPERMSNGDETTIRILLQNQQRFFYKVLIIEELPHQFNVRDFQFKQSLKPHQNAQLTYTLQPFQRGLYHFGNLNLYLSTFLGFLQKKIVIKTACQVKVYPSYLSLKKYDLLSLKYSPNVGIRKTRKIGHSLEFEQIKNYTIGDNIRHLNWKSTAKRNQLMLNQFTDEKSKEVYCIVDTGRSMKFPFQKLTLVDYAINASLIILKNALNFQDKSGVMSFNKNVTNYIKAEQTPRHMIKILESLYAVQSEFLETDFSKLYIHLKRLISHRSLLFLFTNFEDYDALERQLPYLKAINKSHVLVVIFFKNVELEHALHDNTIRDLYQQTIIEKQLLDKKRIVSELNKNNIQSLLTRPQDLTIDVLNKYLEIKAKSLV